jgi:DNA-binding response OmpR family regulator
MFAAADWGDNVLEPSSMPARHRIMIVEDDPALSKLVRKALTANGYDVDIAEHGLEGLMKIDVAKTKPDLLIVDVMMPELDGISLVRALKTQGHTRRIPVIFVTAKADSKTIAEGISVGAKFYITKPFTIDDLLDKVRRAIG